METTKVRDKLEPNHYKINDTKNLSSEIMSNVKHFNNYIDNELSSSKFSFDNNFTHFLLWMNDVKSTISNEISKNKREIQLKRFALTRNEAEDKSKVFITNNPFDNSNLIGLRQKLEDCLKNSNRNGKKRRKNLSLNAEKEVTSKKLKMNVIEEREIISSSSNSKFNFEEEEIINVDSNISEPNEDAIIINQLEQKKENDDMHVIAEQPSKEEELVILSVDLSNNQNTKETNKEKEDKENLSNFSVDNVLQNLNDSDIRELTGIKKKESPIQPTTCELTPIGFTKAKKQDSEVINMSYKLDNLAIETNEVKENKENISSALNINSNQNISVKTPKAVNINFTFYKEKPQEKNIIHSENWKDKAHIYNMIFNNNQSYSKNEQSPVVIPKWNPVTSVTNNEKNDQSKGKVVSSYVKSVNVLSSKKQMTNTLTKNLIEPEYEITDKSESSDEDSDYKNETPNFKREKKQKEIPKWAKDNNYIFKRTQYQKKYLNPKIIFGQCKIDHLNLNVIFYTEKQKYNKRGDSADWRLDNTLSSINDDGNTGDKQALKVNRQLFSEDVNK